MQKIKASGIPFCGSYRDAIAEKEYNIDQCNVRIAELEAINADLLAALENQVNCWEAMLEHALRLEDSGMAYSCRNAIHHARAAIAKATTTK